MDEDLLWMADAVKYFTLIKGKKGAYAVMTDDVAGMTFVGRWVRTDTLVDIPEGKSWAEFSHMEGK